jgi:hypothetical protein
MTALIWAALGTGWLIALGLLLAVFAGAKRREAAHAQSVRDLRGGRR